MPAGALATPDALRIESSLMDVMLPLLRVLMNIALVILLLFVGHEVYSSSPTYGGYVILSLQYPIQQYASEISSSASAFVAALPSSRKRTLVCEKGSMCYKYILHWLTMHCGNMARDQRAVDI